MTNSKYYTVPYNILLVGEHQLFNEAIRIIINQVFPNSQIVIQTTLINSFSNLSQLDYKFLIIELQSGNIDAKDLIKLYRQQFPNLNIIIISSINDIRSIQGFLDIGVNCFLPKSSTIEQFETALINTLNGNKFISDEYSAQMLNTMLNHKLVPLTKKEIEILRIVVSGKTVKATAAMLNLSIHTIVAHRRNIMRKLNIHNAIDLVQYALKNNLI